MISVALLFYQGLELALSRVQTVAEFALSVVIHVCTSWQWKKGNIYRSKVLHMQTGAFVPLPITVRLSACLLESCAISRAVDSSLPITILMRVESNEIDAFAVVRAPVLLAGALSLVQLAWRCTEASLTVVWSRHTRMHSWALIHDYILCNNTRISIQARCTCGLLRRTNVLIITRHNIEMKEVTSGA